MVFVLLLFVSVPASAATYENVRLGIIRGDNVNVRAEANSDSEILGTLDEGTQVTVLRSQGEYFVIEYRGREGFVIDDFLSLRDYRVGRVNASYVIVRAAASTESEKLTTLDDGDKVNVYGEDGDFYRVTANEYVGYISKQFINISDSSSSSSSYSSSKSSSSKSDSSSSSSSSKNYSRNTTPGSYTDDDLYLVAQLIYAEGKGQSVEGYQAMASVVYNRLTSKRFPNSIYDVVFQSGQFTVVNKGSFLETKPSSRAKDAVQKVFVEGVVTLPPEVMYFKSTNQSKEWGSREYYATIDGNMYYS